MNNGGFVFMPTKPSHRHVMVPPGNEDIQIYVKSTLPVYMRVMATACKAAGAADI